MGPRAVRAAFCGLAVEQLLACSGCAGWGIVQVVCAVHKARLVVAWRGRSGHVACDGCQHPLPATQGPQLWPGIRERRRRRRLKRPLPFGLCGVPPARRKGQSHDHSRTETLQKLFRGDERKRTCTASVAAWATRKKGAFDRELRIPRVCFACRPASKTPTYEHCNACVGASVRWRWEP